MARTRARGQPPRSLIEAAYPFAVEIRQPRLTGFGQRLNELEDLAKRCGEHAKTSRRARDVIADPLSEWSQWRFATADAASRFRAEAERIMPGFVEPADEKRQR